ncbi:MAG: ComEC/Rec2 family competence protein [Bryobacteraceae bacterium]
MKDPLLAPSVAVACGIGLSHLVWFDLRQTLLAGVLLAVLAMVALRRSRRLALVAGLIALGFAGIAVDVARRPGPPPVIEAPFDETLVLSGCVVEPSVFYQDRDQFTLELAPHANARISLTLRDGETPPELSYGQRVEVEARIRKVHSYHNPGSFDFAIWAARRNLYWNAIMHTGGRPRVLPGRCGSHFFAMVYWLRTAALRRIEQLYRGDEKNRGLMQGILIGDSTKIEKMWTDGFRRTGTYHTLVISGLHVAVLAAVFLFLLRICFLPELPALVIACAATWLYALVSGWGAPAVRAASGLTLFLIARYFHRRGRVMNLLAVIALAYLLADPGQMFEASFELTFLAVAAIAILATPLLDRTSTPYTRSLRDINDTSRDLHLDPRVAQFHVELRLIAETLSYYTGLAQRRLQSSMALLLRLAHFAWEMAVISTVIQIGVALPMAICFHRISFSGFSANTIVVPLLAAVVPIGFLAVFTGWGFPATVAGWLLALAQLVAAWHARLEPNWRVPDPPIWLDVAFVAALLAFSFAIRRGRMWCWPTGAAVAVLFTLVLVHPFPPQIAPGMLELTAIDVGQGDSLFVAFPDGHMMLVDGGGFPPMGRKRQPRLDIGEDMVAPWLWSRSIRRLDVIVATHAHEDHVLGLHAIIDDFHPRELWTGASPPSPVQDALVAHALRAGMRVRPMHAGDTFRFGEAHGAALAPVADYVPADTPGNNDSLVLRLEYRHRSFFLAGDMESPIEDHLVMDGTLRHTDVLKVGHHGSRTSSTEPFLDALHPAFALISDGVDNLFHHPHQQVLDRLAAHHMEVLRTDTVGLITVRTDGQQVTIETWEDDLKPRLMATPARYHF